eukprot:SRR837773.590.p1 GENE.SRR837773.590~~SRR837773.590.p1  ORF type:complete len:613 (-),score=239.61 SRR837773.590:14-1672(-)
MKAAVALVNILVAQPLSKTSTDFHEAMFSALDCVQQGTCMPPATEQLQKVKAVIEASGHKCSLGEVLSLGRAMAFNEPRNYAGVYNVQVAGNKKAVPMQLYTGSGSLEVYVNSTKIKKPTWKAGCTVPLDDSCDSTPSLLTWSTADGNPSAGQLEFRYSLGFSQDAPGNTYTGPYFVGSLAPDGVSLLATGSQNNAAGAIYQNAEVNCDPANSTAQAFDAAGMTQGAPQACFEGSYCITASAKDGSKLGIDNITVGSDFFQLGSTVVAKYSLSDSRFTFTNGLTVTGGVQPYSGSILINNLPALPELTGTLQQVGGPMLTISGHKNVGFASCDKSPKLTGLEKWWKNKGKDYVVGGSIAAVALVILEEVHQGKLPFAGLVSKIGKGVKFVYRKIRGQETQEAQQQVDDGEIQNVEDLNQGIREPKPDQVQDELRSSDQFANLLLETEQSDVESNQIGDRVRKETEVLRNQDLPQELRDEVQNRITQQEIRQQQIVDEQSLQNSKATVIIKEQQNLEDAVKKSEAEQNRVEEQEESSDDFNNENNVVEESLEA